MSAEIIVAWGTSYILLLNSGTAELILLVSKILWNLESFLTNICISTCTLNKYVEPPPVNNTQVSNILTGT